MNLIENIKKNKSLYAYMALFWVCTISAWFAVDRTIWVMELLPAYFGFLTIFILHDKGVRFSNLLNIVIFVQVIVLMIGGVFTYSNVPFFNPTDWLGETLGWERNNYDKLGHFMQGITPYVAAKELLMKKKIVKRSTMQVFLCISVSLAVSAFYELFEYATTMVSSEFATEFVASQGDPFDTQKDMLFAFLGSIFAACAFINYKYGEEEEQALN
ncbi:MAG: DUF2238 domain-containing protein [Paludibacteraceae bacterium]|nr:DUF2238 domain-containing protein [Paludibacteraceae bacterium]